MAEVQEVFNLYVEHLNGLDERHIFGVDTGRKYWKVWQSFDQYHANPQRSVHAFVDKQTGDVHKPGSWKAPQPNGIRYNLLKDLPTIYSKADVYGSYLYKF